MIVIMRDIESFIVILIFVRNWYLSFLSFLLYEFCLDSKERIDFRQRKFKDCYNFFMVKVLYIVVLEYLLKYDFFGFESFFVVLFICFNFKFVL